MNKLAVVIVLILAGFSSTTSADTSHTNKSIGALHSGDSGQDCIMFRLDGVAEADPIVPGGYWFTVPPTHNRYDEMVALLISAKISGRLVNVKTNGAVACGKAEVRNMIVW